MGKSRGVSVQVLAIVLLCFAVQEGYGYPGSWTSNELVTCLGMMGNRHLFEDLSRICSDCQNLFREGNIDGKCRSDCFSTNYFDTCVKALELTDRLSSYKMNASFLRGGKK